MGESDGHSIVVAKEARAIKRRRFLQYALAAVGGAVAIRSPRIVGSIVDLVKEDQPTIGQIYLSGMITGDSGSLLGGSGGITPRGVKELVDRALEGDVKGIIVNIDSGGGSPVPSDAITERFKELDIPTVALVENMAASGAYMIASGCDKIVAQRYSAVGSIGVISPHFDVKDLAENIGVGIEVRKAGHFKDMSHFFRPYTDEERGIMQGLLDQLHEEFVGQVAENRGVSYADIRKVSEGLIYIGPEAIENGLVDVIGREKDAVVLLEEMGGFENAKVVNYFPKGAGLIGKLFGADAYGVGNQFGQGLADGFSANVSQNSGRVQF